MQNPVNGLFQRLILLLVLSLLATVAPAAEPLETQKGMASWYGPGFHGKKTASGERMDQEALIAAHPSWPFGTLVRVTNISNGKSVQVRINDRGPARKARRRGVVIDLSRRAAQVLDFIKKGKTQVRIEVVEWGKR